MNYTFDTTHCLRCKKRTTRLVRLTSDGKETFTTIDICTNEKCNFYRDINKIRNWRILER